MSAAARVFVHQCCLVLALARLCTGDVAHAAGREKEVELHDSRRLEWEGGAGRDAEATALKVDAVMQALVNRLLERGGKHIPSRHEMMETGLQKVDPKAAAQQLEGKLPADVASLVRASVKTSKGASQQPFSEDSLAKALKYLNEMMEKAWKELDDKVIACKEFEDKNRGSFEQVMTDIARLGEQIADLQRLIAASVESINAKDLEILAVQATLKHETSIYMKIYYENKQEMIIRRNDLAVFEFMLKLTKCKAGGAFMQVEKHTNTPGVNMCNTPQGLVLDFKDGRTQQQLERMMTPSARAAIREVLARMDMVRAKEAAALLQRIAKPVETEDDDSSDAGADEDDASPISEVGSEAGKALSALGVATKQKIAEQHSGSEPTSMPKPAPTKPPVLTPPVAKERVVKRLDITVGSVKCPTEPPDCGLLHDNMSLMWGKFKDLVDELQAEMDKNLFEFTMLKENLNAQLEVLRNSKARFILELNEATASLNADREEMAEKEEERKTLEHEYKVFMAKCKKRIEWIFFQDFCSYLVVRAQVMIYSTVSPPDKIVDCDVTPFVPGDCSVPCDDECPDKKNPFGCGGWQTLTRVIVVRPNEFGVRCPELARKRKCGQFKCPVDCVMSKWSGWSKCSKACEGGTKGRTRSIITKPKNGGMSCNTAQESKPCNTGSCDRNCRLKKWSKWSPCSVACGGGFSERWRRVIIPIRGNGRCPKRSSKIRYGIKKCNTHECSGDEVCIAKQDLVLAIDGSGSLQEDGFKILKDFAAGLIDKYKGSYYGFEDMRIGVAQFGNGEILDDGTVSDALLIQPMSNDMEKVKKAVEGLEFKKGFTNMAQAFDLAEKMFLLNGRKKAMSAVLTLTDGKPSFLFQTYEKVLQLKDKHVKLFFSPVTAFAGEELALMKKWASSPWETNLVHVPGLAPMKADPALFRQEMVVKFCPEAMSPSSMMVEEEEVGYMLIAENSHCGTRGEKLGDEVSGAADCAALAQGAEVKAFSLGTHYARGRCYAEGLDVTDAMVAEFNKDRANPPCPGGEWESDDLYDFYVLVPLAAP